MIVENIVQIGNPLLRKKTEVVKNIISKNTNNIIKDLVDSLRHYELVGMAAPQIGENIKIFVTEIRKTPTRDVAMIDKLRVFINPKIVWSSKKEIVIYEGCGSVANSNLFGPVKRPEKIIIRAIDENGKKFKLKTDGLLARVIQHEYDHLFGIEFTQKITDIKKIMSRNEYFKMMGKCKK